jgi:hypothetical protein
MMLRLLAGGLYVAVQCGFHNLSVLALDIALRFAYSLEGKYPVPSVMLEEYIPKSE